MTDRELDTQLRDMFAHHANYNQQKHEKMLQEVTNMYTSKTRLAKYLTHAINLVALIVMIFCLWQFSQTENVKTMLYMAIFILIFYETTVLMKLWWWTVSSRNTILQTLKEMQLQIAELQMVHNAEENGEQ
jgi:fatty acid desaturase